MKNFLPQFSFIALAVVLVNNVSAQNVAGPRLVKDPVPVEIANQPDSPLLISLVSVDTTDERYQKINITIQNVNEKPIRGYVLAGEMITTSFFPAKPFLRGLVHNDQILVASENIRSNDFKVTLLVDYVAYADRTGWGADNEKRSDSVSGQTNGARSAAADVAALIQSGGIAGIEKLLSKPAAEFDVPTSPAFNNQSESWVRGYRTGYRAFIHFVLARHTQPDFETLFEEARKYLD